MHLFTILLAVWAAVAFGNFILLFFKPAPYGRHITDKVGPVINSSMGWFFMEINSLIIMLVLFLFGNRRDNTVAIVFLGMWIFHYSHRSFIFPLRRRGGANMMPLFIMLFALFFNLINAYLNGRYLFMLAPIYNTSWFSDIRFISGAALFVMGFVINIYSDQVLVNLRKEHSEGYRIPHGGLYRFVSCPNYLGEIIEWTGWAIATWSLAGFVFAFWTVANLAPRSRTHHRWYNEHFETYPSKRKALIPFLF
jgi:3-oxo-5-alpha-steroid 4-dehydrogenase 1